MTHQLPQLPFSLDALAPHMSRETLEYHYGKHHQTYVTNLNNLIKGTEFAEALELEAIVQEGAARRPLQQRGPGLEPHVFSGIAWRPTPAVRPAGALAAGTSMLEMGIFRGVQKGVFRPRRSATSAPAGPGWSRRPTALLDIVNMGATPALPLTTGDKALL
jgi:Fe-Mn family superoxide dismutase